MSKHIPSAPGSTRLKKTVPVVKALLECDNVCGVGGLGSVSDTPLDHVLGDRPDLWV